MKYETVLEIDLKKLKNNTKLLAKSYSDYKYKIVDLKDNAHGLGLKIINTMERYGINFCLVGSLKEALEIRKFNKNIPILASYYVTKDEVYDCINNDITITIFSKEYLDRLLNLKFKDSINVQILIDNGSNILGVNKKSDLEYIIKKIEETKNIKLTGLYTDLTSFGISDDYYYNQVNNFYKIIKPFINKDIMIHLNEPIMYHTKLKYVNGIRFDLSILGIEENIEDDFFTKVKIKNIEKKYGALEFPNIDLELIFNITSEVMEIKKVLKNTLVGRSFVAKEDMAVGVIPIGHKDGVTKSIKFVGIDKYKREILADDIDKLFVRIDDDVKIKDKVYILNEERDVYDFLTNLHTNRYYLMSILNRNLTKKYINAEEINDNLL
mgnify:FL=1